MMTLQYQFGFISDAGNRRITNQDSMIIRRGQMDETEVLLLAVADGMGGMARGDQASYTAALALNQWWETELPFFLQQTSLDWNKLEESIYSSITSINQTIREQNILEGNQSGTTLSLLFLIGHTYLFQHIGDSRIYLFRETMCTQLTKDQTWCQQEIDRRHLTREQAANHPMRHVLISALGAEDSFLFERGTGKVKPGDQFLLCSDGFYNEIDVPSLPFSEFIKFSPQKTLDELLETIKNGPAKDNISAILLSCKEGEICLD